MLMRRLGTSFTCDTIAGTTAVAFIGRNKGRNAIAKRNIGNHLARVTAEPAKQIRDVVTTSKNRLAATWVVGRDMIGG
jgi:hypothetical protein